MNFKMLPTIINDFARLKFMGRAGGKKRGKAWGMEGMGWLEAVLAPVRAGAIGD